MGKKFQRDERHKEKAAFTLADKILAEVEGCKNLSNPEELKCSSGALCLGKCKRFGK